MGMNMGRKKKNAAYDLKKNDIIEGALKVFGKKGYEATTIKDICKSSGISEATLYEYFTSKEEVLFSIPDSYTQRFSTKSREILKHITSASEKLRFIIYSYLEFFQNNKLYSSVAFLLLKGNRRFIDSPTYGDVRKWSHVIIEIVQEGIKSGEFRNDIDTYLVRNLVLGIIEHLTIQWLLVGRPEKISDYSGSVFDMVIRAVKKNEEPSDIQITLNNDTLKKFAEFLKSPND
jgi:AcrR family transcriptional regulator